ARAVRIPTNHSSSMGVVERMAGHVVRAADPHGATDPAVGHPQASRRAVHPTDVAPGAMLAGRYRLEELVSEAPYADYLARTWHAIDSVLSRAVLIILLDADDPRTPDVLDAARHAATAADVRFLRVLDALSENGVAYVVQESVRGRTLADLVSEGPLPATPAGWLIREAAQAIGSAHAQGLAHLRLDPDSVLLTNAGTVKIRGLAVEAALRGPMVEPL